MKRLPQLVAEQQTAVAELRQAAETFLLPRVQKVSALVGVLLTGSVARGDARVGPWGLFVDVTVVLEDGATLDLEATFGKNAEPHLPSHCVWLSEKVGVAINVTHWADLESVRTQPDSVVFARAESVVLHDPQGRLKAWKETAFRLTADEIRGRALGHYFRLDYLTNDYRMEKWNHREAPVQVAQNLNEATECYLQFLYCVNGLFVPRKDWLAYLSYEVETKPLGHPQALETLYWNADLEARLAVLLSLKHWMTEYSQSKGWL